MALLTQTATLRYPQRRMAQPESGDGPWGEAITYWLDQKKLTQADLLRAVAAAAKTAGGKKKMNKNTISSVTRGFDCNTNTLRLVATALDVPLDQVLVSPHRKAANEERRKLALDITERVLRQMESAGTPVALAASAEPTQTPGAQQSPFLKESVQAGLAEIRRVEAENAKRKKRKQSASPKRGRGK